MFLKSPFFGKEKPPKGNRAKISSKAFIPNVARDNWDLLTDYLPR